MLSSLLSSRLLQRIRCSCHLFATRSVAAHLQNGHWYEEMCDAVPFLAVRHALKKNIRKTISTCAGFSFLFMYSLHGCIGKAYTISFIR
jgi:hypothetical protein